MKPVILFIRGEQMSKIVYREGMVWQPPPPSYQPRVGLSVISRLYCLSFFFSFVRTLGRVNHLFVFNFHGFEIGRYVACNVQDPNQDVLKPSAPYQRSHQRTKEAWKKVANSSTGEEWIIPGEKPIRYNCCLLK